MGLDLLPIDTGNGINNLNDFVKKLRRLKKSSIVNAGTYALWELMRSRLPLKDMGIYDKSHAANSLIKAYGARVVMLALATCNEHRDKAIKSTGEFYDLCSDFLSIPSSISSQEYLESESVQLVKSLSKASIPQKYITQDYMRSTASRLFIARSVMSQHHSYRTGLEEIYTDFEVIKEIDKLANGVASEIIQNEFGMSPLLVIRSAIALFSVGMDKDKNGKLNLANMNCEARLTEILEIDSETCIKVAELISCKESDLLQKWYYGEVLKEHPFYQQYVPDWLNRNPIIHLDLERKPSQYLIPSPQAFIRGFRQALFGKLAFQLRARKQNGIIGEAIENHIHRALISIFGQDNIIKIVDVGRKADFKIRLTKIDLFIEVKTSLGDLGNTPVMSPEYLPEVWSRLHGACQQCSASINKEAQDGRLKLACIIVANHMTVESMPFQGFAMESNLFKDMGLQAVEFMPWHSFEVTLANTSQSSLEEALIKKWQTNSPNSIENFMTLTFPRQEKPVHDNQHLKASEREIFARI